jgi:osmotically-inducible protein OsmY
MLVVDEAAHARDDTGDDVDIGIKKKKASWAERLGWLTAGAAIGATVSYLLDPDRGQARRTELEQQAGRIAREAADTTRASVEDGAQRAVGAVKEATPEVEQPADAVVLERVRSDAIGPSSARNSGIVTTIDHGVVAVRGQVESDEQRRDLFGRIQAVDGVRDVEDLTHLPGEPAPTRS